MLVGESGTVVPLLTSAASSPWHPSHAGNGMLHTQSFPYCVWGRTHFQCTGKITDYHSYSSTDNYHGLYARFTLPCWQKGLQHRWSREGDLVTCSPHNRNTSSGTCKGWTEKSLSSLDVISFFILLPISFLIHIHDGELMQCVIAHYKAVLGQYMYDPTNGKSSPRGIRAMLPNEKNSQRR